MSGLDSPLRDQYTEVRSCNHAHHNNTLNHNSLLLVRYNFQATIYTVERKEQLEAWENITPQETRKDYDIFISIHMVILNINYFNDISFISFEFIY